MTPMWTPSAGFTISFSHRTASWIAITPCRTVMFMGRDFKHACVTGGAGFIGSHLVAALLRKRLAVTVLDDLSVGKRENVPSGVPIVAGDILDTELVTDTLSGCDVVFHLAARVAAGQGIGRVLCPECLLQLLGHRK